jgi:hypothetical protein
LHLQECSGGPSGPAASEITYGERRDGSDGTTLSAVVVAASQKPSVTHERVRSLIRPVDTVFVRLAPNRFLDPYTVDRPITGDRNHSGQWRSFLGRIIGRVPPDTEEHILQGVLSFPPVADDMQKYAEKFR